MTCCLNSLTLALMGSDDMHLRVLATSSADEKEKKNAKAVLKLQRPALGPGGEHGCKGGPVHSLNESSPDQVLLLSNVVSALGVQQWHSLTAFPQIVNESLPIFLDDVLGGGVAAVVVSTVGSTRRVNRPVQTDAAARRP